MSDKEREQSENEPAETDAKEDLELKDEDADQVRGGIYSKFDPKK